VAVAPDLVAGVHPTAQPAPPLPAPLAPTTGKSPADQVLALQHRLEDLGFWVGQLDGKYAWTTNQAVMAFQKYNGLKPNGNADAATVARLNTAEFRAVGQGYDGDLTEVDKGLQLLFVIRGGRTVWTLNVSTGSGKDYTEVNQKDGGTITGHAITPEGTFKVYRIFSDGWEKGQLGELYRPRYFSGGVAIHGLTQVPSYPASHGCVRVSIPAMDWIWANDIIPMKSVVWVHP
jgi:peptidoglycan hydrolase-like protein with peptidoglycan-binding domain